MVDYYICIYDRGSREKNQDSIAVHKMQTRKGELTMAVICDGCGGHDMGEKASGTAVLDLSCWFYDELPEVIRKGKPGDIERSVQRVLFRIHEKLAKEGGEKKLKLGTTLGMVLMLDHKFMAFWIGDTGIFRVGRKAKKLSRDHAKDGALTRCLGLGSFKAADHIKGSIRRGGLLIMSDGVLAGIREKDLEGAFSLQRTENRESAARSMDTLKRTATAGGKADNLSAVYLHREVR